MAAIRRRTKERNRHGRAVVLQELAAQVDPMSPAQIKKNRRDAERLRRKARERDDA